MYCQFDFMKFQSLEFFPSKKSQLLEIALINSVNKNIDSLNILGSVVPTESQNEHYIKVRLGETNFIFWSMGKTAKMSGSVRRQNKNVI